MVKTKLWDNMQEKKKQRPNSSNISNIFLFIVDRKVILIFMESSVKLNI